MPWYNWLDRLELRHGVVVQVSASSLILELLRGLAERIATGMQPLDRLILRETTVEILESLRPRERAIAVLRLEGLNDVQIGRILGMEQSSVTRCMRRARRRIIAQVPGAADLLADRKRPGGSPRPPDAPLERGWICSWEEEAPGAEPASGSRQRRK